jgi:hypothetical protein
MKANPRIGPAAPAKKNLIPSDRYSDMIEGFSRRCDVAVGFELEEACDVGAEEVGLEGEVAGICTEEAVVLIDVLSRLLGLEIVA